MNKRFFTFLFFLALLAGTIYLTSQERHDPDKELVKHTEKQIEAARAEIDTLKARLSTIKKKMNADSLKNISVVNVYKSENLRLRRNAKNVNFKEYSDSALDSVVNFLYPVPSTR